MDSNLFNKEKVAVSSNCKGCTERKVSCHGTCEKYLQYLQEKQNFRDEKEKKEHSAVNEYRMEKKKRIEAKLERNKWKRKY